MGGVEKKEVRAAFTAAAAAAPVVNPFLRALVDIFVLKSFAGIYKMFCTILVTAKMNVKITSQGVIDLVSFQGKILACPGRHAIYIRCSVFLIFQGRIMKFMPP